MLPCGIEGGKCLYMEPSHTDTPEVMSNTTEMLDLWQQKPDRKRKRGRHKIWQCKKKKIMLKYFTSSKKLNGLTVHLQKDSDNCYNSKNGDNALRQIAGEMGNGLEQPRWKPPREGCQAHPWNTGSPWSTPCLQHGMYTTAKELWTDPAMRTLLSLY